MSRKHNTKHRRARSRYPQRLKKRGVKNADVRMEDLATLRRRAQRDLPGGQLLPPVDEEYAEAAW